MKKSFSKMLYGGVIVTITEDPELKGLPKIEFADEHHGISCSLMELRKFLKEYDGSN